MKNTNNTSEKATPEILCISTFPPRECGIATYTQDLITALNKQFDQSFNLQICALENLDEQHNYTNKVGHILNVDIQGSFDELAIAIKKNKAIKMVLIQHEFGLYAGKEQELLDFMAILTIPIAIVFHTVLPNPIAAMRENVNSIAMHAQSVIVMTNASKEILLRDYSITAEKIAVIPHGTHLIQHADKEILKKKYDLTGKTVLSTFGLLSPGKSIETTLEALPTIIKQNPDIIFLVIGKTHPTIVKKHGENYRNMLESKVKEMGIMSHVRFVNVFLDLSELLEYLQLTDIYLFTSNDPNQAVSGTFSYAVSCGCPVISTPIPQAKEVLKDNADLLFEFGNSEQLSQAVNSLLRENSLRSKISSEALHQTASTAWENAAIGHAIVFWQLIENNAEALSYSLPTIKLNHLEKMTTDFGFIQFSRLNHPDILSGYTLDDNARAMIAICKHYELSGSLDDLRLINIYLNFIHFCQLENGSFLNYVDEKKQFTTQNDRVNLEDANGRAIWALGYILAMQAILPEEINLLAKSIMESALVSARDYRSPRATAFIIKGIYYKSKTFKTPQDIRLLKNLSNNLVSHFQKEKRANWIWFESYLTYANSVLPEALLDAWEITGLDIYREIAIDSFHFLLSKTFTNHAISVVSNKTWLHRDNVDGKYPIGGEQPIDIAYTILALDRFYTVTGNPKYAEKMNTAFSWFLGNNFLHNIIYNPCTGGCYDGLENNCVNLNQGAESTICYLLSRLVMEEIKKSDTANHSEYESEKYSETTAPA